MIRESATNATLSWWHAALRKSLSGDDRFVKKGQSSIHGKLRDSPRRHGDSEGSSVANLLLASHGTVQHYQPTS
jgi:hypothetical protein